MKTQQTAPVPLFRHSGTGTLEVGAFTIWRAALIARASGDDHARLFAYRTLTIASHAAAHWRLRQLAIGILLSLGGPACQA